MKKTAEVFEELVAIIARLRDPQGGCPWDLKQTHATLKPYMLEEAYEVVDAIDGPAGKLCEELGDVLLQVVLHAQIAAQEGSFSIADVIATLNEKLIRRHPHVFGAVEAKNAEQVVENWEAIKRTEAQGQRGLLEGVPKSLPSLMRAQRLGEKAARVGFDWKTAPEVKHKIAEELREFLDSDSAAQLEEEFGDLLFSLSQWSRKAGLTAEEALQRSNNKFSARFKKMEELATKPLEQHSVAELDELWERAKAG